MSTIHVNEKSFDLLMCNAGDISTSLRGIEKHLVRMTEELEDSQQDLVDELYWLASLLACTTKATEELSGELEQYKRWAKEMGIDTWFPPSPVLEATYRLEKKMLAEMQALRETGVSAEREAA